MNPVRQGDGVGLSAAGFSEVREGDGTVLWSQGGAIPDSGLARFEFEQNLADSWNSNGLTETGGISYTTNSQYGDYAAVLDGGNDYATAPFSFASSDDFSVVGWVYLDNTTGIYDPLFAQRDSFSTLDWDLYYDSGNSTWTLGLGDSASGLHQLGVSASTGVWTHVALTKGGDQYTVYFDAVQDAQITDSTFYAGNETLRVGAWDSGADLLDGRLDHHDWFTKELTATEVSNHHNTGSING